MCGQGSHGQGKMKKKSRSEKSQGISNLVREIQNVCKSQGKVMNFKNFHIFGSQMIITVHKYM